MLLPRCQDWYQGASSILCDVYCQITGVGRGCPLPIVPRLQKIRKVLFYFFEENKGRAGECYILNSICYVLGAERPLIKGFITRRNIAQEYAQNSILNHFGGNEPGQPGTPMLVNIGKLRMAAIGHSHMPLIFVINNVLSAAVFWIYRSRMSNLFGLEEHIKPPSPFVASTTMNSIIYCAGGGEIE